MAASIDRHELCAADDHVLVAFSGGADSTALALILKNLGYRVTLAHVDHGMRLDSHVDATHCALAARRLNMNFQSLKVVVSPGTEAEARRQRYAALEQMRENSEAGRIATGHNMNDQAETVRMRLDRGGFGLGIPASRGRIVRPILDISRAETEQICRESGFDYLEDPTNQDLRFTRNRIRSEFRDVPASEIERYVAVGAKSRLAANGVDAAVRRLAETGVQLVSQDPVQVTIDPAILMAAPDPVARGLIRFALQTAGLNPTSRLLQNILVKVAPAAGKSLDVGEGLCIWSDEETDKLVISPRRRTEQPKNLPAFEAARPGVTFNEDWGIQLVVGDPSRLRARSPVTRSTGRLGQDFDADRLRGPLIVRQWQAGDRFRPLKADSGGASGAPSKKLQDLFVDEKTPRNQRYEVPLVTSDGEIAWVAGYRLDDRFKLTDGTRWFTRVEI
ncbi:MAG: tRNA lysidine(34) synthetase TilS, partial [Actinomycetota bacterium]